MNSAMRFALSSCVLVSSVACGLITPTGDSNSNETDGSTNANVQSTDTTGGSTAGGATGATEGTTTASGTSTGAVPGTHALNLIGSGYTPHAGQTLGAALVGNNNTVLATKTTTVATDGTFTITFSAAVNVGQTYTVNYYADLNKNGFCNAPPTDHSWSTPVPSVTGDTNVLVMHNETFSAVCESFGNFNLTFAGSAFTPHNNQNMFIGLADRADGSLVGQVQKQVVVNGVVNFTWPGILVSGHSYSLAYFADVNANSTCDALPTDHQWVQVIPAVTAAVAATGNHADTQQAMCTNLPTGVLTVQ